MKMPDPHLLGGMGVLAAIIDTGSFGWAAEALDVSQSGVRRAITLSMGLFPYEQRREVAKPTPKTAPPDFAKRKFAPLFTSQANGRPSKICLSYRHYAT